MAKRLPIATTNKIAATPELQSKVLILLIWNRRGCLDLRRSLRVAVPRPEPAEW
jgi:hypothetical protein